MHGRHDRNIRAFGKEGQEALRRLKVTVVGVGGLGTHVVQQLAYLGVGEIGLIDSEEMDITNLNRYVGACPEDVGNPKVEIGERIVKRIDPGIVIWKVYDSLVSQEAYAVVKNADYIFSCIDSEAIRLILNELCLAYERPFFDLASEIIPGDPLIYGGRVCFISDSTGCLYCLGVLDRTEVSLELQDPSHKQDLKNLYGMNERDLGDIGPSVVSVNGVVASLAVTEFIAVVTGLRPGIRLLKYYGEQGALRISKDQGDENCFYCKGVRGLKDKADMDRYIRNGLSH
jgi:hypothetical protein